jgi:hypothetical protein
VAIGFPAACSTDPPAAIGDEFDADSTFNIYCNQSVVDTTVSMDFAAA